MNLPDARYILLRTFRKSGSPVDTPVWAASRDSDTHYIFSAADAGKVKRIRNSSAAQVTTCDARGGRPGEWQDCHAYLVTGNEESAEAYRLLRVKYGWQMKMTDFFSRLAGRIHHRMVIRLETKG
jgi:PPOX class probable F420-dependent enzyme